MEEELLAKIAEVKARKTITHIELTLIHNWERSLEIIKRIKPNGK
jgi:hypothetical protein